MLRPLLPELAGVLPPEPQPSSGGGAAGPGAGQHQLFRALREVLQSLCPLTLVLEDLHWADELTVDLVRYLLAGPIAGLSLVLTMRAEKAQPAVRALGSWLPPPVQRLRVRLEPLDESKRSPPPAVPTF